MPTCSVDAVVLVKMCSSVSDDARVVLSEKGQTSGEVGHDADRFIATNSNAGARVAVLSAW